MLTTRAISGIIVLAVASSGRGELHWSNSSGGQFSNPLNWSPAVPPGFDDQYIFDLNAAYSVSLDEPILPGRVSTVARGHVSFEIVASPAIMTMNIEGALADLARLDVLSGRLRGIVRMGMAAGNYGSLRVAGPGAAIETFDITIGSDGEAELVVENHGLITQFGDQSARIGPRGSAVVREHGGWSAWEMRMGGSLAVATGGVVTVEEFTGAGQTTVTSGGRLYSYSIRGGAFDVTDGGQMSSGRTSGAVIDVDGPGSTASFSDSFLSLSGSEVTVTNGAYWSAAVARGVMGNISGVGTLFESSDRYADRSRLAIAEGARASVRALADESEVFVTGEGSSFCASLVFGSTVRVEDGAGFRPQAAQIQIYGDSRVEIGASGNCAASLIRLGVSTFVVEAGGHVEADQIDVGIDGLLGAGTAHLSIARGGSLTADTVRLNRSGSIGVLSGGGTINADIVSDGVIAPGDGIGTLHVIGSLQQSAAGHLEIAVGSAERTLSDRVEVDGNMTVGGVLDVTIDQTQHIPFNVPLQIAAATSLTGSFQEINLFNFDPSWSVQVTYTEHAVILVVLPSASTAVSCISWSWIFIARRRRG